MTTPPPPNNPDPHALPQFLADSGGGLPCEAAEKKVIPETLAQRETITALAAKMAESLPRNLPLSRHEMELRSNEVLKELAMPEQYLGWTMVALASAFWSHSVESIPCHRRLLLLPRCLRKTPGCPAECDETELLCKSCGQCSLGDLKRQAETLGYRVLIAEGSPAVMQIILAGEVDAILGVACLNVLEKTLDKILLAGIPAVALPLLRDNCENTEVDLDYVLKMVELPYTPDEETLTGGSKTKTFLHLMRAAAGLFENRHLDSLLGRLPNTPTLDELESNGIETLDPILCTEAIARDYLAAGGKHSRPFITLAAFDATTGGHTTGPDGAALAAAMPEHVQKIALAVEAFHKASLIHDDIEDDDAYRYDRPTLHRKYGIPTAINVGDFLLGIGYRLVAEAAAKPSNKSRNGWSGSGSTDRPEEDATLVTELLANFSHAHTKLCEGQGAELIWRDTHKKTLTPLDALRIYALKTAPAFECALLAGMRLAGPIAAETRQAAVRFARHLGVAYQILNDLDDWCDPASGAMSGKRTRASDLLSGRPTILWALAMETLPPSAQEELTKLSNDQGFDLATITRAVTFYGEADVFNRANRLVQKHYNKAREAAESFQSTAMRSLFDFLADAILDRRPLAFAEGVETTTQP